MSAKTAGSSTPLQLLLRAQLAEPHSYLGMHPVTKGQQRSVVVRAFLPQASDCVVVEVGTKPERSHPMTRIAPEGVFEAQIGEHADVFAYQLRATLGSGEIRQFSDPYSFLPTISEHDLYLFNQGNEHFIYKKLGAHLREVEGVRGVTFAVWAPAAARVSVVGNFNQWDGRAHPMRPLGGSGVWEIFIPGLGEGEVYKYELRTQSGAITLKTDPYGTYFEAPPNNASIVCNTRRYQWGDSEWLAQRAKQPTLDRPMSVYEMHLGSWKRIVEDANRPLTYREIAPLLAEYVLEMGFTHVELMPLAEHPFEGSWGYQVTGFFAPTHRYGTPEDFQFFVDYLHQRGIGVILDWVPAHFPRDSFALPNFDGTHLYEHADPKQGAHQDWGTLIFNYGRHEVRCFLVANALSWLDRFHLDGLRVDAVASMLYLDYSRKEGEWIPNKFGGRENLEAIEFLKQVNGLVHHYYPGVLMIAEESTAFAGITKPTQDGGIGFDLKWNMGWMHDTLRFFQKEPVHRKWHMNDLTFGMLYQYSENFVLSFSHDEVVHGKGSLLLKMGQWHIPDKAANLRALYAHQWMWPGKKLLFMGSEWGQSREWAYDRSLDWHLLQYPDHAGIRLLVRDLNQLYRDEPVLGLNDINHQGFRWIAAWDADNSVVAYLRLSERFPDEQILVVGNFTPLTRRGYRIGAPRAGFWREIFNSNSEYYGGGGEGNGGGLPTQPVPWDGYSDSLELLLPAMSTVVFKWRKEG